MGERLVGYCLPVPANRGDSALQVDCVPEHDGGNHEVQPTCAMPLVLVRAIPQFGVTIATVQNPTLKVCWTWSDRARGKGCRSAGLLRAATPPTVAWTAELTVGSKTDVFGDTDYGYSVGAVYGSLSPRSFVRGTATVEVTQLSYNSAVSVSLSIDAAVPDTLVSNTGQTARTQLGTLRDVAQRFTTGTNASYRAVGAGASGHSWRVLPLGLPESSGPWCGVGGGLAACTCAPPHPPSPVSSLSKSRFQGV